LPRTIQRKDFVVKRSISTLDTGDDTVETGPGARLTRKQLLDVGLRIITEDGIDALTMRSLATALDVSRGAMYRYFADKQTFLEELADSLYGTVRLSPAKLQDWEFGLRTLFYELSRLHDARPWIATVMRDREFREPRETPNVSRLGYIVVGLLRSAGLHEREVELASVTCAEYISGSEIQARLRDKGLPTASGAKRLRPRDYLLFSVDVLIAGIKEVVGQG
jgi:AcrR family transcriptional regulator